MARSPNNASNESISELPSIQDQLKDVQESTRQELASKSPETESSKEVSRDSSAERTAYDAAVEKEVQGFNLGTTEIAKRLRDLGGSTDRLSAIEKEVQVAESDYRTKADSIMVGRQAEPAEAPPEQKPETADETLDRLSKDEQALSELFDRLMKQTVYKAQKDQLSETTNDVALNEVRRKLEEARGRKNSLIESRGPTAEQIPAASPSDRAETIPAAPSADITSPIPVSKTISASALEQQQWSAADKLKTPTTAKHQVVKTEMMPASDAARVASESDAANKNRVSGNFSLPENPTPNLSESEMTGLETDEGNDEYAEVNDEDIIEENSPDSTLESMTPEARADQMTLLKNEISKMERNIATTKEMIDQGLDEKDTYLSERKKMLTTKRVELNALEQAAAKEKPNDQN